MFVHAEYTHTEYDVYGAEHSMKRVGILPVNKNKKE